MSSGISERAISTDQLDYRLIDLGRQQADLGTWLHYFDTVPFIIFAVDLDTYDQYLGQPPQSELLTTLRWFHKVVNYRWRRGTGLFLLLNKARKFHEKLGNSPLEDYFVSAATQNHRYTAEVHGVLRRFTQACPPEICLYSVVKDDTECSILDEILAAVGDRLIQTALYNTILD